MKILQISVHFSPNVGGVETHLDDLVKGLSESYKVFVLTYRPLVTKAKWKMFVSKRNLQILRIPWLPGFFYALIQNPIFEFIYLTPGIFLATPFVIVFFNPDVVHAHGLVAGFVGVFWAKLFRKRIVISTHSLYDFPKSGLYYQFAKWIFKNADTTLCLSNQSREEIIKLGINPIKVKQFIYWVDLDHFKPITDAKKQLGWKEKFTCLFVGRLVTEKGIPELIKSVDYLNQNIVIRIAGAGPLEKEVKNAGSDKLVFLGKVDQSEIPVYYSAADVVIVPSTHEEGFGRVILESLACGTPIIAANRGAIPEAMDKTVGAIIDVTPKSLANKINKFQKNKNHLEAITKNTRKYATVRFSNKNAKEIVKSYVND